MRRPQRQSIRSLVQKAVPITFGQSKLTRPKSESDVNQQRILLSTFFINFVFFGAAAILVGAAVPEIVRTFVWSYSEMGAVMASGAIGYFTSTLLCGILLRRWGPRPVLVGGLMLQAAGLAAFGQTPSFWFNLLALALFGLGEGASEVVTNFCLVRIEYRGRSNLMNFIHSAFTAGAIAGPLVVGQLIERGLPWQHAFEGLAAISVLMAIAFSLQSFVAVPPAGTQRARVALVHLLRQPLMAFLALAILLYVGVEIGVSNWIAEYVVQKLGTSAAMGAYMVSLFWLGLLVGRLAIAAFYRSDDQETLLVASCALATLALVLALLNLGFAWTAACFFISGMGFASIYPVVVVLAGRHFASEQGLAIAIISTGGGMGSFAFPFAIAALADHWGIERAFWAYALTAVAMSASAAAAFVWVRRANTSVDV